MCKEWDMRRPNHDVWARGQSKRGNDRRRKNGKRCRHESRACRDVFIYEFNYPPTVNRKTHRFPGTRSTTPTVQKMNWNFQPSLAEVHANVYEYSENNTTVSRFLDQESFIGHPCFFHSDTSIASKHRPFTDYSSLSNRTRQGSNEVHAIKFPDHWWWQQQILRTRCIICTVAPIQKGIQALHYAIAHHQRVDQKAKIIFGMPTIHRTTHDASGSHQEVGIVQEFPRHGGIGRRRHSECDWFGIWFEVAQLCRTIETSFVPSWQSCPLLEKREGVIFEFDFAR